jgi:hypothetical protein
LLVLRSLPNSDRVVVFTVRKTASGLGQFGIVDPMDLPMPIRDLHILPVPSHLHQAITSRTP